MVSSDTISTAFGIAGNATALSLYLSPIPTFYKIWKKKCVEEFSAIPAVVTFLNCMIWVLYGLPIVKLNNLVLVLNVAGVAIELCYIFVYLLYSKGQKRVTVVVLLLLELIFVAIVATVVLSVFPTHERRTLVIGILCIIVCMMMYVSPLSVMSLVLRTKSVEYMPLYLSVVSFLNGICWTIYSVITFDVNILIPNGVGVVFSIVQLVLHAMYYRSTQRQLAERKIKGDVALTDVGNNANIVAPVNEV